MPVQRNPECANVERRVIRRRPPGMAPQKPGERTEIGEVFVAVDLHVPAPCAHVLGEQVPLPGVVADGVQFRPVEVVAINLDFLVNVQFVEPAPEGFFDREWISGPGAAVLVDGENNAVRMVVQQGQGTTGIPIVVGNQHPDFDGGRIHGSVPPALDLPNDFRRIAGADAAGRDGTRHHRARRHDGIMPDGHALEDQRAHSDPHPVFYDDGGSVRQGLAIFRHDGAHVGVQDFDVPGDGTVRADRNGSLAVDMRSVADDRVRADAQNGQIRRSASGRADPHAMAELDAVAQFDLGKSLPNPQSGAGIDLSVPVEFGGLAQATEPTESRGDLLDPRRVAQVGQPR